MNSNVLNEQEYLSIILERLKQRKFHIENNITYKNQFFPFVAKRTLFERERLSLFNTIFLFSKFQNPDFQALKNFSKKSYKYARNKYFNLYLPPILFWGLKCFPVAIVDSIDKETDDSVRFNTPPRHFGAFEKLVVFNVKNQTFSFWMLSSVTFSLPDELDRKLIKEILVP
jgi:hypothetical protein